MRCMHFERDRLFGIKYLQIECSIQMMLLLVSLRRALTSGADRVRSKRVTLPVAPMTDILGVLRTFTPAASWKRH